MAAKYKVVVQKPSGGITYDLADPSYSIEREALDPIGAEIVEVPAKTEEEFIAAARDADVVVVQAGWESFFDEYLGDAAENEPSADAIVPSPLMPHLMFDWLMRRARARWPRRVVERRALRRPPHIPWQQAVSSGTHVVSFAEWVCPVNCVEPATCPVIKGPRTWSVPPAVRAYVAAEQRRPTPLAGPVIFHCEHRAYGVGMFDTQAVLEGDALVARAAAHNAADVLVGTVSHCHGALDVLHVGHGHAA